MTDDVARLREALMNIQESLLALGRATSLGALQPGVSGEHVREVLGRVSLSSSDAIEALYGWRNGLSADVDLPLGDLWLLPGFYLSSVEDALADYSAFVEDSRWNSEWFPLFPNGGGDFLVLDFSLETTGAIRHFRIDESEHPVEFQSLTSMLVTYADAFRQGVIFVDEDGLLEQDDDAFAALAAGHNPGVAWWVE